MEEYTEFEKTLIEHFKKQHLAWTLENAEETIYDSVVRHIYGEGSRDPSMTIMWGKVYEENMCPSCSHTITLKGGEYTCKTCNFTIPVKTYDEAAQQYRNRRALFQEDKKLMEEVKEKGIKPFNLDRLYETGKKQAEEELNAMEKRTFKGGRLGR